MSARGSLAIVVDFKHVLEVSAKRGCLGVRLNLVRLCLGKTNRCRHVTFMRVFSIFGNVILCPGWIRVYVSCRLDVIELFCRVVLSLLLLPFSR